MRKYAIWGTSDVPDPRGVGAGGREGVRGGRLRRSSTTTPTPTSSSTCSTRRTRRRSAAPSRGTYSASFYELDEVPDDVLSTSYPKLVRTLANVVVLHVPGQGVWFTTMERGTYKISRRPGRGVRAARAAREVEARDRQRVRHRPRARALGRRRGHRRHQRRRQADGRARPAAGAVPGARVPQRARPAPRDAALPGRRPLLRQPLGPQGRDAVLDERRAASTSRSSRRRAATSCSSRATTSANARMRDQRAARRSSRGASRSTRSSTG